MQLDVERSGKVFDAVVAHILGDYIYGTCDGLMTLLTYGNNDKNILAVVIYTDENSYENVTIGFNKETGIIVGQHDKIGAKESITRESCIEILEEISMKFLPSSQS